MWAFVLVAVGLLAGCGRVHFEPPVTGDATIADGSASDSADDTNDGAPGPSTVTYTASIAECTDPGAPDPAFCRTANGVTELPVDTDDDNLNVPFHSYLRFDFDQVIAGREITAVVLRLVVSDGAQSNGPSSGEIWRVTTFTASSLQTQTPTQVGTVLGAEQGPVVQLQEVTWSLPVSVIDTDFLCLGMIPLSADGVNYWSLQGVDPPRIRIDLL